MLILAGVRGPLTPQKSVGRLVPDPLGAWVEESGGVRTWKERDLQWKR